MSTDQTTTEEAEEEVTPSAATAAASPRTLPGSPQIWLFGAGAFALAALVVAVVFGIMWWVTATGDNAGLARSRDDVVKQGTAAVKAYTEVDYTHLDDYFANQKAVSNDDMSKQIDAARPNYSKALTDQKVKVSTTVQDIAVEELDDHDGKASFLAAITTMNSAGGQTASKAIRLEVSMVRVGSDWKLSGIDNVPLVAAGQ
jgi:Mce-associated membrane protein